jgi:hypothetical protein
VTRITTTVEMKVFSTSSEFDYPWEEVSVGNWQKYSPWNEKADHVLAVDTLSRTVDQATGIVRYLKPRHDNHH